MIKDFLSSDFIYWSDMPLDDRKTIFSFGGGVDSTGMLFEFDRQGWMPDILIFADTGGERPDIYAHIKKLNVWLKDKWKKQIIVVSGKETLYDECLRRATLPSLAMGFHTCSQKHKIRPIAQWLRKNGHTKIIKIIGFDANEFDRARRSLTSLENGKNTEEYNLDMKVWFPLIEWGKSRKELKQEINEIGFCASKSSCFFCPAMSLTEVKQLKDFYPELYYQAIYMEQNAKLDRTSGLGRSWNWNETINAEEQQINLFDEDTWKDLKGVETCGCINW